MEGVRPHRDEVGRGIGGQVQRVGEFLPVQEIETGHRTVQPFQFLRAESQQTERFTQFHEMLPARGHHHEPPARGEYPGELVRIAGSENAEHGVQDSRCDGQATPDVGNDGSQAWAASGRAATGRRRDIHRQTGRPGGRVEESTDVVAGSSPRIKDPVGVSQGGDHLPGQWLVPPP